MAGALNLHRRHEGRITYGRDSNADALGVGSVAIDVIPEVDCVDADDEPWTTDQRGPPRLETGGTTCDVGAFEV